ncbi:hypothetical protein G6F59_016170 [Rhizopus arrhizus]|nr:hypothetical protein G6F59_016170 [Rhizopus arrhizus]
MREVVAGNGAAPAPADKTAILANVAASGFLRIQQPDAQATSVLQPFKAKVDAFSASLVASVPQELCSRRVPGGPASACAAATFSSWWRRPIWTWPTPTTAARTSRCKAAAACACPCWAT